MTIAVTAVSGQLGSSIARSLLARKTGKPVIGLARSPEKVGVTGIEVRQGEYTDKVGMVRALAGVETLLMVSLNTLPKQRTGQHQMAIAAAKEAGVRRVVYTSVQGAEEGTAFSPVIQSNRQTEADLKASGMEWTVGRNGIYIEPDVAYIDRYIQAGEVANCAGDGKCGYTTRTELAEAYANLLLDDRHCGQTYDLHGALLTQSELTAHLNSAFGTALRYRPMSVEDYRADRIAELYEMMGTIIAGIYEGIRRGAMDRPSDFEAATGRPHQTWTDYFTDIYNARPKP